MVAAGPLRQLAIHTAADWRAFIRQMRVTFGRGRTRPGLYPYRLQSPHGKVCLHLRIHQDGSGALFVNVDHVLHLSPMAAEIARMLLDGIAPRRVTTLLRGWYPDAPPDELEADVAALAQTVAALKEPTDGCPTCALDIMRRPVFSTRAPAPYKADLALTYRCNNNCAHCYNEPGRKGMASLGLQDWRRILEALAQVGVPHIIFTGGEPTLVEHLPRLVRHATSLGQVTGINTNGRRLADARFARALADAGLDHVQITLASHLPSVHNRVVGAPAFDETLAGIRNALDAGLHTITNTTLTRDSSPHALEVVEFLHQLGLTTFAMNGMICAGGGRRNPTALAEGELIPVLQEVRERAQQLGMRFLWYTPTEYCRLSPIALGLDPKACNAAEYSICVEPNGDVLPCQSYYRAAGNLLRDPWDTIWDSPLFRSIRMRRENPREAGLPERCWNCEDLEICGGGCPLQRAERELACTS